MLALVAGPFLLIQPADFIANTVKFPLGLTRVTYPACLGCWLWLSGLTRPPVMPP